MTNNGKRLFLLDAYALIYRGYYAFIRNPRINSKGQNTSAVYGFVNTLLDIINREKPELLAVVFDKGGSAMREEMFESYKANRLEQPEAIELAVPYIKRILERMHIPVLEKEGWEADDLIGTLAKKAEKKGYQVYIVTADKDFGQIVSDKIKIYRPSSSGGGYEIWDVAKVKEKFGVERPEQVIDFLAMTGDSVDNVPGIPGVGEKTAKKFLAEFGSLENLYENTGRLKGKMKEKVEAAKDLAFLSKKLVTIHTDAPVEFNEADFHLSEPDTGATLDIFNELEFRRLAERFKETFGVRQEKMQAGTPYSLFDTSETTQTDTVTKTRPSGEILQMIDSEKSLEKLLEKLEGSKTFAVAWYPQNFDFARPLEALFFSVSGGLTHQVDVSAFPKHDFFEKIKPVFLDKAKTLVGHNLKELTKYLLYNKIIPENPYRDTLIMHYLINPDMQHNLSRLTETYFGLRLTEPDKKKAGLSEWKDFYRHSLPVLRPLAGKLETELKDRQGLNLLDQIEMPLIAVLAKMENEGIALDTEALKELAKEIDEKIRLLEEKIYAEAGEKFNIASPKQLGTILFEKLKIDSKPKKTKTGQYSTSEEVLSKYKFRFPIVDAILEWRQLQKLKNTYIEALPKQIHPETGKIHTHFNQAVTATGRLSSTDPNLQNIPVRTESGRKIRAAFIPAKPENKILAADYSQIELRLIAVLSGDENMLESFRRGEDIHRATAAKLFGVPPGEVTRDQRAKAKTVNFGIIYGVSAHGLSRQTGLSRTEAKELIEAYFKTYPKLREYLQKQIEFAREHGYVETIMGRRRYLPDIHSRNAVVRGAAERIAINAPVQGSAADIIKKAMTDIDREIEQNNLPAKLLLQVHDELVFEIDPGKEPEIIEAVRDKMENAVTLPIPLKTDINTGRNWLEAH